MAHIQKTVQVAKPVGTVYEEWMRLEELVPFVDGFKRIRPEGVVQLTWRAEVLTFAPEGGGTVVTLRIDYDACGVPEAIRRALASASRRLQGDLQKFKELVEDGEAELGGWGMGFTVSEPAPA